MGDEVAAVDPAPGEAQDYFALLAVRPRALLPKLVLHWGCADDAAARVAALLGCDLVAEVSPEDMVAGGLRCSARCSACGDSANAPPCLAATSSPRWSPSDVCYMDFAYACVCNTCQSLGGTVPRSCP